MLEYRVSDLNQISYTTSKTTMTIKLSTGKSYAFYVQARNQIGYS